MAKKYKRSSRRRGGFSKLKRQVQKIAKQVYPLNYKYILATTVTYATTINNSSPAAYLLNGIATGTDELSRVGDICQLHNLDLAMNIAAQATLTRQTFVRVMLIWEGKSALAALASFSQVLDSATPQTFAQRNNTTRDPKRFRILYDRTLALGPRTGASNYAVPDNVRVHIKRKLGLVTDYSRGTAGTVSDIDTGVLTLFIFTDTGDANAITATGSHTIRFTDS